MDLNIKNLFPVKIGTLEIWITETIVNTWVIMALLIVFAIVVRMRLRKFQEIPKGFQNVIEAMVEAFDNFAVGALGEELMYLGGWFFMMFAFILISNISGVLGLRPPTADWATTFALALSTFFLIQAMGVKYRKLGYLKSFFEPIFIFFPLNVISELARPVSLSFRLFGNVLAGTILMKLMYSLAPIYTRFGIPAVLHVYFDLFTGALQTYIFCMLSLMFVKTASSPD